MKSIRRRLTAGFLAGFGLLWLGAGTTIYYSYRSGLMAGMEAELLNLCRQVRTTVGGPGRGWRAEPPIDPEALGPDVFWQVWDAEGAGVFRSGNLAADLPRLSGDGVERMTLADGTRVMIAGRQFGGGGRRGFGRGAMEVTVARPLDEIRGKLNRLLAGLLAVGAGGVAAGWWCVSLWVRRGLAPLDRIAGQVAAIDVNALNGRFAESGLPAELQPIAGRLDELMERLGESFRRERRFSADLAHEMRTPVAELRTIAESAVKWPDEGGPAAWRDVVASVKRMESVVQAMLQLARVEREAAAAETLGLRDLIEALWADHRALAESRGVTLRLEFPTGFELTGDRGMWSHLLGNLLGNAAEYADAPGEVVVVADSSRVIVSNPARKLKPEEVERLFDRFWRGDEARGESVHCGLGLSLARACAEGMGLRLVARLRDDGWLEMRAGK
ncbi:ATP-binding protein [Haloferula sargassicola]|uniref:histidine kinase n=1 Tax=Haloferula sargassicola TaxID=490096 RepID=A0ABP9UI11_9BACT